MSDIQIRKLNKSYGDKTVFKDLSIDLYDNRINIIMGASGSGKSTLFRILLGLEDHWSGEITVYDKNDLSMVFQEDRLLESYNILDNLKFVSKDLDKYFAMELIRTFELEKFMEQPIDNFSGGMKRRVAIMRGLINKNKIIFMDEPFKGLDKKLKIKIISYCKEIFKNKLVFISTHNEEEIKYLGSNNIIKL